MGTAAMWEPPVPAASDVRLDVVECIVGMTRRCRARFMECGEPRHDPVEIQYTVQSRQVTETRRGDGLDLNGSVVQ